MRTPQPKKRLSRDGLPIDAREWTEADWRDLYEAVARVKRNVRARHAAGAKGDAEQGRDD